FRITCLSGNRKIKLHQVGSTFGYSTGRRLGRSKHIRRFAVTENNAVNIARSGYQGLSIKRECYPTQAIRTRAPAFTIFRAEITTAVARDENIVGVCITVFALYIPIELVSSKHVGFQLAPVCRELRVRMQYKNICISRISVSCW